MNCVHRWEIPMSKNKKVKAVCAKCGAVQDFKNATVGVKAAVARVRTIGDWLDRQNQRGYDKPTKFH